MKCPLVLLPLDSWNAPMSGSELPKVVNKSPAEIDAAIAAIQASALPLDIKDFSISCIRLSIWLPNALLNHQITVTNLRNLVFGCGDKNKPHKKSTHNKEESKTSINDSENTTNSDKSADIEKSKNKNPPAIRGHGRLSHSAYTNTIDHCLSIDNLNAGDQCPMLCGGKLYRFDPGVIVRVQGQNLAAVHKYFVDKLRCGSCSHLISADIPSHIGKEKYDAAFKAILTLQKYYVATPFYRQASFNQLLGFPLPASTQWQLVEEVGSAALLVFPALERMSANGDIVHNDDSYVKITDVIRHNRMNPDKKRTGMFTTGFISRTSQRDIALFYNSTLHAGENIERLLKKRDVNAGMVIQMCDALSRNTPSTFQTILCNCLSHGFRKFNDLKDFYPKPCICVIELIAKVYDNDDKTRGMTKHQRLEYHQQHSEPIMDELHAYLTQQLESKQVEPNDSLGKAMRYMLKHWHALTQFLRVLGAPLDNNIVERALKIPIRGRRTWLFYKTEYSAMIGGVLTSIIYTCALSGINPLNYLIALQKYKNQIVKEPERWLPWSYQDTLAGLSLAA